jgi:bifunctional oligoribonuclease and PAP phosphatase NrnA
MMLDDIVKVIESTENALIVTHERPDGDALGSVFALLEFYLEQGKNASVFLPEDIPAKYNQYLPKQNVFIESLPAEKENFNFLICLDCSDEKRLGLPDSLKDQIPKEKTINIDHHFDNNEFGISNYIDAKACAVGEILFDILTEIKTYKMSKKVANSILTAIITDTGGLRFDNTTSDVFAKISVLMECGADYLDIIKAMYFRKSYSVHLLESDIALNHLKWNFDNKFVYTYLSDDLLSKYNVSLKEIEGLIDSYRVLDNTLIAALITKRNDGYKISLRSNNAKYPVVDIAHEIGGGGHKMAAGCFLKSDDISFVEKRLNELVKKVL